MRHSHLVVLTLAATAVHATAAQVEDLGSLEGLGAAASAISSDGSTVLVTRDRDQNDTEIFRWTRDGGVELLGTQGGITAFGAGLSDDGAYAAGTVGWSSAARWDSSGTAQVIGALGAFSSGARAISGDGSTVVGSYSLNQVGNHAFHWTSPQGLVDIHPPFGTGSSFVEAVSADGSVVVGWVQQGGPATSAFVWTAAGGSVDITPTGALSLYAQDVSADGTVVAGVGDFGAGFREPFRWTAATGVTLLGLPLPGEPCYRAELSADGSTIYGLSTTGFTWTQGAGYTLLEPQGLFVPTASSADGSVIVGNRRRTNFSYVAARWTNAGGLQDLTEAGGTASEALDVSADGSSTVGWARRVDGVQRAVLWRTDQTIGSTFCDPAIPNSTGAYAAMSLRGSNVISLEELELVADHMPTSSFGFFLGSNQAFQGSMPAGSQGRLCLGGEIGRFVGPGQVQNSGASGSFSLTIDPRVLPSPTGPVTPLHGETWSFQAWFRDANPQLTSNFTTGAAVTLY